MTIDRQRTISSLELAKALHPAASRGPRPAQLDEQGPGAPVPDRPTGAGAEVLAVLWEERLCRARLRSVVQGWLSCTGREERLPITIVAVEGDDVLLVARVTSEGSGAGAGRTATLEVGGASTDGRRWTVRASGRLQTVVPEGPLRSTAAGDRPGSPGPRASEPGGFAVLALTISSIRGFETTRPPARA